MSYQVARIIPRIFSFDVFSVVCVGLMWTGPFLYYFHGYPITTFYQEWWAALLGLLALSGLLLTRGFWQSAEVPRIVLLPLGMALIVLVQYLSGRLAYMEQGMLAIYYLVWAAGIAVLGYHMRKRCDVQKTVMVLSIFLLAGAELSALIGILQYFRWHTFLDAVITPLNAEGVYGNTAQPNHYANYVTLGFLSLVLLHYRGYLNHYAAILLGSPLLFAIVMSGSRSSWLYMFWLAGLTYLWQRRGRQYSRLLIDLLCAMAVMLLIVGLAKLHWFSASVAGGTTSVDRLFAQANAVGGVGGLSSSSIRAYLWYESILMLLKMPWLGIGIGQFAWLHFQMAPQLHNLNINGLYNNAHSLVFQVAAEMGIAGLLLLLGTAMLWIRQFRRAEMSVEAWWGGGLLSVIAIHGLLEYPLWYAYFMGIAAFLLGWLDKTSFPLPRPAWWKLPVYLVLLFALASIQQLYSNYRIVEGVLMGRSPAESEASYLNRVWSGLLKVRNESIFRPQADMFLAMTVDAAPMSVEDKQLVYKRVIRFMPIGGLVYKQILYLGRLGQVDEARKLMDSAAWSYPGQFNALQVQLMTLAQLEPAHFLELSKHAEQIYSEQQAREKNKSGRP